MEAWLKGEMHAGREVVVIHFGSISYLKYEGKWEPGHKREDADQLNRTVLCLIRMCYLHHISDHFKITMITFISRWFEDPGGKEQMQSS